METDEQKSKRKKENAMKRTLGEKISELRKQQGLTQDGLAEKMGVTSQAVSKWENDLSIPDLPVLLELSGFFHVTLDELVREKEETVRLVPEGSRKNIQDMLLRVRVLSADGDRVQVNLPLALVKMAKDMNMELPKLGGASLKDLDLDLLISLAEKGVMGKLIEVESADGDSVQVTVE